MKITKFEDLKIWQIALRITRDQIRRAIISVSSNIVEGFEKNNNNEFIRFLKIAKGSIGEVRNQLYIALAVNYINQEEFEKLNNELIELANQVGKFISYLETNRKLVNSSTRNKLIKK